MSARLSATTTALSSVLAAHTFSVIGNTITVFAMPFLVRSLGGSAADVGLATAVATIPVVVGGPLSGVLIDWLGPRRFSIFSDLISGLTVLAIALLSSSDDTPARYGME
ncbi:hypothetical protein KIMH_07780 [Bombiscardovia apis]|uniref:Major facilitator superfamily (MFS) profile domain-containing protein n=1 Tax=Bombiscardovia apis TaxID=2932182 RepID=A0ABM8BCM5_9BIFI|nr:MFS transporter [Bombiscardovia apis]BDR54667.1 hypothetical protein KIMH_07780 [Bombiscardovia apis]